MKNAKRILAFALSACLLITSLVACGASSSTTTSTSASESQTDEQYTGAPVAATLPLTEERVTFTVYVQNSSSGVLNNYAELKAIQEACDRMNVTLEFIHPVQGSETDQFNLMIASGDYPDIIMWDFTTSAITLDTLMEDGVVVDMDSLIRQYAPNYLDVLTWIDGIDAAAKNDDGKYASMHQLEPYDRQHAFAGPGLRKDILDKHNLEVPVTINDWHELLTVIKEKEPDAIPFSVLPLTEGSPITTFMPAYHTYYDFHIDVDTDEVVYGPITDNYKEYLKEMQKWYAEGLIDPEYMTKDMGTAFGQLGRNAFSSQMLLSGVIGILTKSMRAYNEEFEFLGTPWPVLNEGDAMYNLNTRTLVNAFSGVVTSACENPVLAVQVMDYFYSQEGADLMNWGIEGESYEIVDGTKTYTEAMRNNPNGKSFTENVQEWTQPLYYFTKIYDPVAWAEITLELPEQKTAYENWQQGSSKMMLPAIVLPADQTSQYTRIMNDINTYMNEMTLQFITGQTSIDDNFDRYVATIESMNLETARSYKAAAYEAYLSR